MKLFFKISFSLFFLLIIAIVGFVLTFNPNDYKDEIITLVKENTGRQLSIPGDIYLSLFPWIGLELGKVEISNAKGFSKKPFAKMSHLQVRAKFLPLLQSRLEADTLVITGLILNLEKNTQGKGNWEDLQQNTAAKKTTSSTNQEKSSANLLAAFAINGIKITQSQFNFNNKQQKQNTSVKNVQLEIGQLKENTAIPVSVQFEIQQSAFQAKINFINNISFSSDFNQIIFNDLNLKTEIKLPNLKKAQTVSLVSKNITLNLSDQTAKSKSTTFAFNDVKLTTSFSAKKIFSQPTLFAQLNIETLNPRNVINSFDIDLPEMSDKKALTKFNVKTDIKASLKKVVLSNLLMTLDDTQIKGSSTIHLASASDIKLNINTINIDRYLPPPPKGDNTKAAPKKQKSDLEVALIPVALLTQVDLTAKIKIKALTVKNTKWKSVVIAAKARKGDIKINPIKLQGYGSSINASLNLKATEQNASLTATLKTKNIQSGKILKDFMQVKNLQGLTSITTSISTKGTKLSQLKRNLKGEFQFGLQDGIIKGFDLEYEINKLNAKIKGLPAPATPTPLQTKFTNLSASGVIKQGVIYNKDLRAATPFTRIIGQGNVSLTKEQLNYVASVKFTNSRDIGSKKTFEKMSALPLDVNIRGTFDKPQIKADFSKALKALAKQKLKKREEKLKEEAKDKLKKKLGDKLKKLFRF